MLKFAHGHVPVAPVSILASQVLAIGSCGSKWGVYQLFSYMEVTYRACQLHVEAAASD